jgi:hypothetical protein
MTCRQNWGYNDNVNVPMVMSYRVNSEHILIDAIVPIIPEILQAFPWNVPHSGKELDRGSGRGGLEWKQLDLP